MRSSQTKSGRVEDKLFLLAIGTCCAVFYYNLGLMPLLDDEPTRALVSWEMVVSGNYIVPTTHGELYQNKPPLFNWFIAALMHTNPHFNELSLRLPSMLAFIATAVLVYVFFRKELSAPTALVTSLAYLTCGRVLFYDSMLGYIDPFYTLALFADVCVLYQFVKSKRHGWIFFASYFLCLVAFMFKGLPALVFHGITLTIALFAARKHTLFFSLPHLAGAAVFFIGLALYYTAYALQQEVGGLFATLWEQSSKRTLTEFTKGEAAIHILTFPLQFVMHFLPWTLLAFVFFYQQSWTHIRQHKCLAFCTLVFIGNIWVYWVSPETKPRYLFVFLPLFFAVSIELFFRLVHERAKRVVYWVVMSLSMACAVAVAAPPFVPQLQSSEPLVLVSILAFSVIVLLVILYMHRPPVWYLTSFVFVLLCVRLVFNHVVLPARKAEAPESYYKATGERIGRMSQTAPIHLLPGAMIDHDLAFYISSTNRRILSYTQDSLRKGEYYICSEQLLTAHKLEPAFSFKTNFQNATLFVAQKR